jgi:acylpyruvate hydrolase
MRLATVREGSLTYAARVEGDELVRLPHADVGALLATDRWRSLAAVAGPHLPLAGASLAPLVPAPDKIICLGQNYEAHTRELGRERPAYPNLFAKFRAALIGASDPIVLPQVSTQVDWEVELAVVIGRPARHVDEAEAESVIAGYTVLNDVSARDWQFRTSQFLQGKTFASTTPLGPWLVTVDEVGPAPDLRLTCDIDGARMQEGRTGDMTFGPAAVVSYISHILPLLPGDIIATGTPAGVGMGRDPQVFLQPGQTVRSEIERIGVMTNPTVAEP